MLFCRNFYNRWHFCSQILHTHLLDEDTQLHNCTEHCPKCIKNDKEKKTIARDEMKSGHWTGSR